MRKQKEASMLKIFIFTISAVISFLIFSNDSVYASSVRNCTNIYRTNTVACISDSCISAIKKTSAILHTLQPINGVDIRVSDEFEAQLQIMKIDISFSLLQTEKGKTTHHVNKELRDLYGSYNIIEENPHLQNAVSLFQSLSYPYILAINKAISLSKSYQKIELESMAELSEAQNKSGIWRNLRQTYAEWMAKRLNEAIAVDEENITALNKSAQLYMNALVQVANEQRIQMLNQLRSENHITDTIYFEEMMNGSLTNGYFSLVPFSDKVPIFTEMDRLSMRSLYDKTIEQNKHKH